MKKYSTVKKGKFIKDFNGSFSKGREVRITGENENEYFIAINNDINNTCPFKKEYIKIIGNSPEKDQPLKARKVKNKLKELCKKYKNNDNLKLNSFSKQGCLSKVNRYIITSFEGNMINNYYSKLDNHLKINKDLINYTITRDYFVGIEKAEKLYNEGIGIIIFDVKNQIAIIKNKDFGVII